MQAAFVAKEWVDYALGQAREAEGKLEIVERAYAEADKKLKETLSQLTEVGSFKRTLKLPWSATKNKLQSPRRHKRRLKSSWP